MKIETNIKKHELDENELIRNDNEMKRPCRVNTGDYSGVDHPKEVQVNRPRRIRNAKEMRFKLFLEKEKWKNQRNESQKQ